MYTTDISEKLTPEQVKSYVDDWNSSADKKRIRMYKKYYTGENPYIGKRVKDRAYRNKTPNNNVPTAYYTTVVDSMAGYMFNDVKYQSEDEYQEVITDVNQVNKQPVKDMKTGIMALAYNKAVELVYIDVDLIPRYTCLDPEDVILIYDITVEPEIFCAIWVRSDDDNVQKVDVLYADEWQYWQIKSGQITQRDESLQLYFDSCPVAVYNTQIIGEKSPFHQIIPYIDALDVLVTGNSNEVDRLVDALLVLGRRVAPEELEHMDEWKTLEGLKSDDRAEYLTKDMSPTFREYVSRLLVQEIHKHGHVVDWYNPDTGLSGAASGKALQTRLFDMDMYSKRIEKVFREGAQKRLDLIGQVLSIHGVSVEPVEVVYTRDTISDFETVVDALNKATFLSAKTKIEEAGFDYVKEKERLDEEKAEIGDSFVQGFETE